MTGAKDFKPDTDIPSLVGKVILITGGTSGLGRASVLALAKHNPAHIYFTGRSSTRASSLISQIEETISPSPPLTFLNLDLASLASIKECVATSFKHDTLDVLMCNAGVAALPPGLSEDGFEIQFAVNHLGHALLVKLLTGALLKAAAATGGDARVVFNTSLGWKGHPKGGIQFENLRTPQDTFPILGRWFRYGQSKLANIVYAKELARRVPSVTTVSLHPGMVATEMVAGLSFLDRLVMHIHTFGRGGLMRPEQGVANQLWLAVGARKGKGEGDEKENGDAIVSGGYYMPSGVLSEGDLDEDAKSEDLARRLWEWTEEALKDY